MTSNNPNKITDFNVNGPSGYLQGDIVWVLFPFTNLTKDKVRPALVVSNDIVNNTGDYLLMQITSRIKYDGLSMEILDIGYEEAPLELQSFLRVHKIFTLNSSLIQSKATSTTMDCMKSVFSNLLKITVGNISL